MTLYMKLGGRKAIMQAMPRLLARLDEDPCFDLGPYRREIEHSDDLSEFLVFLAGGAPAYDGKPVCELLSPICTGDEVYNRFVDHLVAVLFGESPQHDDETDLRQLMDRLRPRVLNPRPTKPVLVYSVDTTMQIA
ncbi:MAG: hypothetical protein Tsb0019_17260 [Roseibium sp.]